MLLIVIGALLVYSSLTNQFSGVAQGITEGTVGSPSQPPKTAPGGAKDRKEVE
jgi:hypothetical protein